jgi:hypothetical protein
MFGIKDWFMQTSTGNWNNIYLVTDLSAYKLDLIYGGLLIILSVHIDDCHCLDMDDCC